MQLVVNPLAGGHGCADITVSGDLTQSQQKVSPSAHHTSVQGRSRDGIIIHKEQSLRRSTNDDDGGGGGKSREDYKIRGTWNVKTCDTGNKFNSPHSSICPKWNYVKLLKNT